MTETREVYRKLGSTGLRCHMLGFGCYRIAAGDEVHEREMDEYLDQPAHRVFLAERPGGGLCGFLEASIHPWAVGCDRQPVGYIEGWYVDADVRRRGRHYPFSVSPSGRQARR